MYWGWKSGQEPDGPASKRNPSELTKTQFVEKGREHSSWCLFWGQDHDRGGERHPCNSWLTPWSGPEWANRPGNWIHKCPGASTGLHAFCECPQSQSLARGKDFVLISKVNSVQKRTKGTSCAAGQPECGNVTNQSPTRIWDIKDLQRQDLCKRRGSDDVDLEWVVNRCPPLAQENSGWKCLVQGPIEGLTLFPLWGGRTVPAVAQKPLRRCLLLSGEPRWSGGTPLKCVVGPNYAENPRR